jgi:spore coat protein U-like protein
MARRSFLDFPIAGRVSGAPAVQVGPHTSYPKPLHRERNHLVKIRYTFAALASVGILFGASLLPASAAKHHANPNVSTSFGVTGTVTADCTINSSGNGLSFSYDPITNAGTGSTSSDDVSYTCTNGSNVSVSATGANGNPGTTTYCAAANAQCLDYNLFIAYASNNCPGGQYELTDGQTYGSQPPGGTGNPEDFSFCANAAGGQPQAAEGTYTDTVTVAISAT